MLDLNIHRFNLHCSKTNRYPHFEWKMCVTWVPRGRWRNLINKNWSFGKYDQSRKHLNVPHGSHMESNGNWIKLEGAFPAKKDSVKITTTTTTSRAWRSQTPAAAIAKYPSCLGHPVDTRPESHVGKSPWGGPPIQGKGEWFWGGTVVKGSQFLQYLFCAGNRTDRCNKTTIQARVFGSIRWICVNLISRWHLDWSQSHGNLLYCEWQQI